MTHDGTTGCAQSGPLMEITESFPTLSAAGAWFRRAPNRNTGLPGSMTAFQLMDVMSKSTARNARSLIPPIPRVWNVRGTDITALLLANGALIVGLWARHSGPDQFSTLGGTITASGQLTALLGTYIALIALVLMSRSPWLDQLFGIYGLASAHRWLGFACVWLLCAHAALTTVGFALQDRRSIPSEAFALLMTYP